MTWGSREKKKNEHSEKNKNLEHVLGPYNDVYEKIFLSGHSIGAKYVPSGTLQRPSKTTKKGHFSCFLPETSPCMTLLTYNFAQAPFLCTC